MRFGVRTMRTEDVWFASTGPGQTCEEVLTTVRKITLNRGRRSETVEQQICGIRNREMN